MWEESEELDIAKALGADDSLTAIQALTLYIPSHDRDGRMLFDRDRWLDEAAELLVTLGGGVTIPPAYRGGWRNPETGRTVWEQPVLPYTYVDPDLFVEGLPRLRDFLHRMGRTTRQGEVAFEFNGEFRRVTAFDDTE